MFYGPGAGSLETASAVVSDVMNVAKYGFTGNFVTDQVSEISAESNHAHYYLRFDSDRGAQLQDLAVEFEVLEAGSDYVVITGEVAGDLIRQIEADLAPQAVYPVIVKE